MRLGSWAGATNRVSLHPGTSGSLNTHDSDWGLGSAIREQCGGSSSSSSRQVLLEEELLR